MDNARETMFVTEIERSAYHDGPGLRTVVFLQGCPLHCSWCCNPETQPTHPVLLHDGEKCVGCGACAAACPYEAVRIENGKAVIDRRRCAGCGSCLAVCPLGLNTLSAKEMTIDEIMEEVCRDRAYYDATGGGLTLSGGEPLLHPNTAALLRRAKEQGISTLVETTLNVPWERAKEALPHIDRFFVDYKHPSAAALKFATGAELSLIERNIEELMRLGMDVTLRTPVIPGFNDGEADLRRCFQYARSLGMQSYVLLPYHALGRKKYGKLDLPYPMGEAQTMPPEALAPIAAIGAQMGLAVRIGG